MLDSLVTVNFLRTTKEFRWPLCLLEYENYEPPKLAVSYPLDAYIPFQQDRCYAHRGLPSPWLVTDIEVRNVSFCTHLLTCLMLFRVEQNPTSIMDMGVPRDLVWRW